MSSEEDTPETSASERNDLPSLVRNLFEAAINRGFARLDPDTFQRLASLEGRVAAVRFEPAGQPIYLSFSERGLELIDPPSGRVDVTVSGSPLALLRLMIASGEGQGALPADVTITGDMTVAKQLRSVFGRLEVDWEEQLSHLVGDIAAHQLARATRITRDWSRYAAKTLLLDTGEYLSEEIRLVPSRNEINAFVTAVDVLRDDADRLEKRIERLQKRAGRTA